MDRLGFIGFCFYCNHPVVKETGYYLAPNSLPYPNGYDTAKPVHRKCHRGQDEELPIGPGDDTIYMG